MSISPVLQGCLTILLATDPLIIGKNSNSENVLVSIPQIDRFWIFCGDQGGYLYFAIDEDCTIRVKCGFTTKFKRQRVGRAATQEKTKLNQNHSFPKRQNQKYLQKVLFSKTYSRTRVASTSITGNNCYKKKKKKLKNLAAKIWCDILWACTWQRGHSMLLNETEILSWCIGNTRNLVNLIL